jgi:ubiquinone/menaquinone biosynthesis C-methylase UbiE/uncharacterized protein YbaR (Trm112 family)
MIESWFIDNLACPIDHQSLRADGEGLVCAEGHRYPIVDGVPIMLRPDVRQTIALADASLRRARSQEQDGRAPGLYLESLGISDAEKEGVISLAAASAAIDPVVAYLVAATNGLTYKHLVGQLKEYPIPDLPLPHGRSKRLLDVGCSWGRWTLAAHAKGYQPVGIDPSLGAVMAARRVARQLGAPNRYLVADARYLPFPPQSFDVTYSYSVLQHMSASDVTLAVGEMGRVLINGGHAKVQMPTKFGVRCLYHQARRAFRSARGFEVRYWTIPNLVQLFERHVGAASVEVDCYFGIGLQRADEPVMTPPLRRVLRASERLKAASRTWSPLVWAADSVFVEATSRA